MLLISFQTPFSNYQLKAMLSEKPNKISKDVDDTCNLYYYAPKKSVAQIVSDLQLLGKNIRFLDTQKKKTRPP